MKFVLIIIAVLLGSIMIAGVVFSTSIITNAKYLSTISLTNTGSSILSNQIGVFTLSTSDMIAGGMLNSSANECAILANGVDIVFQPSVNATYPWCLAAGSLPAFSNSYNNLYSKDVTGGSIKYFPGNGGLAATDNANMEWGSSGNVTLSGYYDTTSTGNICNKYGAISFNGQGDGTLKLAVGTTGGLGFTSIATNNNSGTNTINLAVTLPAGYILGDCLIATVTTYNTTAFATITAPSGWVELYQKTNGTYNTHGAWYKICAGTENATVSWIANETVNYSWCTLRCYRNSYMGVPIAVTAVAGTATAPDTPDLTSGFGALDTTWLTEIQSSQAEATAPAGYTGYCSSGANNYYTYICGKTSTAASDNPGVFPTGSNWIGTTIALQGASTVISGTISSGVRNISGYIGGGNIGIKVDNTAASTVAFAGNVTNNSNPWNIDAGYIMPYVSYIQMQKGGSNSGYWSWSYAATFPDQSGHGNTGTPTFRTTSSSAYLTVTVIKQESIVTNNNPSSNTTDGWSMLTTVPPEPDDLYAESGHGFPLGSYITETAKNLGQNVETYLFAVAFGLAALAMVGVFAITNKVKMGIKGSLLLATISGGSVLIYFYQTQTVPGWVLIPFGLFALLLIVWRKSPAPLD